MTDEGWLKLYRKLRHHPKSKDAGFMWIWLMILLEATHKDYLIDWCGEVITLKPGQFVTSREALAEKTGEHQSKIYRTLRWLESEHQIEQQKSNRSTLITITNWSKYQSGEQQNEQPANNQRTTSEQPANTNKNRKNVRSEEPERELSESYSPEFSDFWDLYPNKTGKGKAWESWQKKRCNVILDIILTSVNLHLDCKKWNPNSKGDTYIPLPSTWLNQNRWEDTPEPFIAFVRKGVNQPYHKRGE